MNETTARAESAVSIGNRCRTAPASLFPAPVEAQSSYPETPQRLGRYDSSHSVPASLSCREPSLHSSRQVMVRGGGTGMCLPHCQRLSSVELPPPPSPAAVDGRVGLAEPTIAGPVTACRDRIGPAPSTLTAANSTNWGKSLTHEISNTHRYGHKDTQMHRQTAG